MNTVKAIAGDFGTWALPADAPKYLSEKQAERFVIVMTERGCDAYFAKRKPPAPSWSEIEAYPLTPERIEYGALAWFTSLPAPTRWQRLKAWLRA